MTKGVILKGIGGFYYVKTADGLVECKPRGIFRKEGVTPMVGDWVEVDGVSIEKILPRKNFLIRPPIANIDCVVVVVAVTLPMPNLMMIDKLLITIENLEIDCVVCLNKTDLADEQTVQALKDLYTQAGYRVACTSSLKDDGIGGLKDILHQGITVFAGASGVGKSSLLNAVNIGFKLIAGEMSIKNARGRHTTRHVELLPFGEGYVADTPGFTSLDLMKVKHEDLQYLFREFTPFIGKCRFRGCSHLAEPSCAVIAAVEDGTISQSRYDNYKQLFAELKEVKSWEK
ncbi:MAG: ribosome small subunit-dependent GTPase A [Hyphomonadaceae bacterium]|nr:ribosome small subunit-dependent GTPase A [Clostridia bacterium]